jgi:tetratricopeptide (TPR) repeat protein
MAVVDRRKFFLSLAGLAVLAMLLISYWPSLRGSFIWDDDDYVVNNWTLRSGPGLEAIWLHPTSLPQWYPMVHTTFWVEYHLWPRFGVSSLNPLGYKIDNLLLHFASSMLLWIILRRLKIPGAWLAAAVFALHPINVESVAWVTERKNVLSGFFYLAALWAYLIRMQNDECSVQNENQETASGSSSSDQTLSLNSDPNPTPVQIDSAHHRHKYKGRRWGGWYFVALGLFVLALLSKTVACSLPVGILLICYYRYGRVAARRWVEMLPFFVIGGVLAWFTAHFEATQVGARGPDWDLTFVQRVLIAGHALCFYAWQLFWPTKLSFVYPKWQINTHSVLQWLYVVIAIAALAASWIYRSKIGRGAFVGLAFYVTAIFPALGFINIYPMRYTYVADHYQYLAGMGLIVWFVAGCEWYAEFVDPKDDLPRLKKWVWHVVSTDVPFVLPLMMLTYTQALGYQSKATLWADTLSKNPDSWMVHLNMGHVYVEQHDGRNAMKEYREAEKLSPDIPDPHYNVGYRLDVNGDYTGALNEFAKAIADDPNYALAYYGRGNVLRKTGKLKEAVEAYQQAIHAQPSYADAWYNMGYTDELLHDTAAAKSAYEHTVAIAPNYPGARENLAKIFISEGNTNAAVEQYELAINADPHNVQCTVALLRLLARLNRPTDFNVVLVKGMKYIPDLKERLLQGHAAVQ